MVDVSYQMVLSTLQTVGLLVGIAYYVLSLNYTRRNQELTLKTRNMTLQYQSINSMMYSPLGLKSMRLVGKASFSSIEEFRELFKDPEFDTALTYVFTVFDYAGLYLEKGVLDIGLFSKTTPWFLKRFWNQYKPIIHENRKALGPSYYRNMEYLFESVEKYWQQHPELAP